MDDIRKKYYKHPMFGVLCKTPDGRFYNFYDSNNNEIHVETPDDLETVYEHDRRVFVEKAVLSIISNGDKVGLNDVRVLSTLYDNIQEIAKGK